MRSALAFLGLLSFASSFLAAQDLDSLFRRAAALVNASRPSEAEELLRALIRRDAANAEARVLLGFLYQTRGRPKESFREFLRSVQLDPRNLPAYFSLIGHAKTERDWTAVLEWARQALSLDRNHPLLYQEMAEAYEKLGRSAEAESARQEAQRCYQAEILYTRACAARRGLRDGEAESILRECLAANPRLSQAWADLGELLRRNHRLEEAQRAFLAALEAAPGNPIAHLGLAATLQAKGKEVEALAAYQTALRRGVATPDLHAGLASLLL